MYPKISYEIWNDNYRAPGEKFVADTWERQAKACSEVEKEEIRDSVYKDFLWLLTDFKGIAGGRITSNLGVDGREATSLMNCFVHNPADIKYKDSDSLSGIYDMLKAQALTLKSEGGYGMNFSWIRPAGSYVSGIGGRTPGVLKFMELWDKSSEVITMGSEKSIEKKTDEKKKIRKGAQMGILACWHPEIEDFIVAKQTEGRLTKFNISVGIGPGFMEAVENNLDWDLIFPDTSVPEYKELWFGDIEDWKSKGLPIKIYKTVKARDLWDSIMKSTYNRNDPGVLFLDVANTYNPLSYAENIATTNPCLHGNTLISVADKRKFVTIKELADIGEDVLVHSLNKETGEVEVKLGRGPRITGYDKTLVRVYFEDGSSVDVTENHNLLTIVNNHIIKKQANKLVFEDSVPRFNSLNVTGKKISRVEKLPGKHTVYNITVDDNHTYAIITDELRGEGIFSANCGEVCMSTGVCLLFSLNLVKYIKRTDNGHEFDFETFKKASAIAVRFADNINDISRVPIEDYKISMTEKRRIGIGVVGLGSMLAILGLRYGSPESLKLVEKIFKTKTETELLTSANLGKEKGSFPLFDNTKYFNSHWWKTLPISDDVRKTVEEIGCMRNSHRSANAPTGNMSIYAGVLSGGIEPMFNLEYVRWSIVPEIDRAELRDKGFNFPDVFKGEWFETDSLKKTKQGTDEILLGEFQGVQYQVDKNRGLTKKSIVEDWAWNFLKDNFSIQEIERRKNAGLLATANELSHTEHIEMLKIIARYVDMNSSKTINLPKDYPYEDFKEIYFDAWKSGIKGITTYREGTMAAVLEKVEEKKDREAPKRPKELPCNIHTVKIDGNKWAVIIGLYDGFPYEVFAGPLGSLELKNGQNGFVVKQKRGEYHLVIDGNTVSIDGISNIVDMFGDNSSAWATRLVSMSLRHNVPINFICEQLNKDGCVTDINKVLSRILKKYIVHKKTDLVCPECGSTNVKLDPCFTCIDCNYGKCG
jgi:ribonucleotide reductase alpha subunit